MQLFKNKKIDLLTFTGILLLAFFVVAAIIGPMLIQIDYRQMDIQQRLTPPGGVFLFGSDQFGRDILVRILYGLRVTIIIAVASALLALSTGLVIGLISGYYGGWVDSFLMRIMDSLLAFPVLLLSIFFITFLGPGISNIIFAIGIAFIPSIARMTRGVILSIKEEAFIEAAKLYGAPNSKIMFFHIIPNVLGPLIVMATLNTGTSILIESTLSFLGIGVRPPSPSLGLMIAEGRGFLELAPWIILIPGIFITLLIIAFNLIGDGLRDVLDPIRKN